MVAEAALLALSMAAGQDKLEEEVRELVGKLRSESVEERGAAIGSLVRRGHRALPYLASPSRSGDLEVRAHVAHVIEKIYATDPLFLVRAPDRRVTVTVERVPLVEAHRRIFQPFPAHPGLAHEFEKERLEAPVTLALKEASYWEAVEKFCEASGTHFSPAFEFMPGSPAKFSLSKRADRYVFAAKAERDDQNVELEITLLMAPGWEPIEVKFKLDAIEPPGGEDLRKRFEEDGGFRWNGRFKTKASEVRAPRLRLRGTARVLLATEVEAVELRAAGFKGPRECALGDYRLTIRNLWVEGRNLSCEWDGAGPGDARPPAGKAFRAEVWDFIADDAGRAVNPTRRSWGGKGRGFLSMQLPGAVPTRLVLLRPLEAETVEIPFEIEAVAVPP